MRFVSAMACSHVAGSDFAFAGQACEASFTLPLTTPIAIDFTDLFAAQAALLHPLAI